MKKGKITVESMCNIFREMHARGRSLSPGEGEISEACTGNVCVKYYSTSSLLATLVYFCTSWAQSCNVPNAFRSCWLSWAPFNGSWEYSWGVHTYYGVTKALSRKVKGMLPYKPQRKKKKTSHIASVLWPHPIVQWVSLSKSRIVA